MIKNFLIFSFFFLFFGPVYSGINNIVDHLNTIENISFSFKQNISEKEETGKCIIKYPKKIFCEYNNFNKKLIISDGKTLLIKNQTSNQLYIYPLKKTALNLILDKDFLISQIKKTKMDLIDDKFYRLRFAKNDIEINIFFDKKTFNIIGWQNFDIYQNFVITYLYDVKINTAIDEKKFKLPKIN